MISESKPDQQTEGDGREQASSSEEYQTAMERAEEVVDRAAEQIASFASEVGHRFQWLMARAREEAEDIWAEAQHLREQKGS